MPGVKTLVRRKLCLGWPSGHVRVQVGTRRQPHKGAAWMVGSEPKCGEDGECQNGKSGTTKERNPPVRKRVLVEPGGWLHKGGPLKKYVNVLRIVEVRFPTVRANRRPHWYLPTDLCFR